MKSKRLFLLGALLIPILAFANHPVGGTMDMTHGTVEVPAHTRVPQIDAILVADDSDGFNLLLHLTNFKLLPPLAGAADRQSTVDGDDVLQGHAHLYINGKKVMRVYGESLHLSSALLTAGLNSITVSVNNHQHQTFTWHGQEIQTTLLIDLHSDSPVKNHFVWPAL